MPAVIRPQRAASAEAHAGPAWIAVALWVGVILFASSDSFSEAHTGSWLRFLLQAVVGEISAERFAIVHQIVRKAAHFVEYAVLGGLALRAVWRTWPRWSRRRWAAAAFLVALACAGIDELNQRTLPSRTGSIRDVALDLTGAAGGVLLTGAVAARRRAGRCGA